MKRRKFIKAFSSSVLGTSFIPSGLSSRFALPLNSLGVDEEKILVLIRLDGGNDGLSCFTPLDQYENLINCRSNILVPENELLPFTDTIGLHPSMEGIKNVFDDKLLAVVQGVSYPNVNKSHFRSTDIWTSGSGGNIIESTGWLGRHLHKLHPNYPNGYPGKLNPDPVAITIGRVLSTTCQGPTTNYGIAVNDPYHTSSLPDDVGGGFSDSYYGSQLDFVATEITKTNVYLKVVEKAAKQGQSKIEYPKGDVAGKLKIIAQLISGGLQTKVYVISQGGYDTHTGQGGIDGRHAKLVHELSGAIHAFQQDLVALGLQDRVLGMTFSEFGRRISSNGGAGTDHGEGGPMIFFGSKVNAGIIGDNPIINKEVRSDENIPMQYDFRSVYGSVLQDWFNVEESVVKEILYEGYKHIPIIKS